MRTLIGTSYPNHTGSSLKGKDPLVKKVKRMLTSSDIEDTSERGSDAPLQKKPLHQELSTKGNDKTNINH